MRLTLNLKKSKALTSPVVKISVQHCLIENFPNVLNHRIPFSPDSHHTQSLLCQGHRFLYHFSPSRPEAWISFRTSAEGSPSLSSLRKILLILQGFASGLSLGSHFLASFLYPRPSVWGIYSVCGSASPPQCHCEPVLGTNIHEWMNEWMRELMMFQGPLGHLSAPTRQAAENTAGSRSGGPALHPKSCSPEKLQTPRPLPSLLSVF